MTADHSSDINLSHTFDVLVIGGGNAALCAAMTARHVGARPQHSLKERAEQEGLRI